MTDSQDAPHKASTLEYEFLGSEDLYRGRNIALRGETYRLPNGQVAGPFTVLDYSDWVNVVALTRNRQAVLVRQYRPGPRTVTLELPGGAINPEDESLEQSMRRELQEETGYGNGRFTYLGSLSPNSASHTNHVHSFVALDVEPVSETRPDDTEFLEVVLLPLDELLATARQGGLEQAMHLATLFLALPYL